MAEVVLVSQQAEEQGNQDSDRTEETLAFLVVFSSADATGDDAMEADDGTTSIPQVDDLVNGKRVKSLDYRRDPDNPNIFTVNVHTSDAQDEKANGDVTEVDIEIDDVTSEEPVYINSSGQAIVNAAGQPYSNPLARSNISHLPRSYPDQPKLPAAGRHNPTST